MNTELNTAITRLIESSLSIAEKTGEFVLAEVPEFLQQLLLWYGVSNFIYFLIGVGIIVIMTWWVRVLPSVIKKYNGDAVDILGPSAIIMTALLLLLVSLLNLTWLKVWIAPKVWLVEYAASLIK